MEASFLLSTIKYKYVANMYVIDANKVHDKDKMLIGTEKPLRISHVGVKINLSIDSIYQVQTK